MYHIHTISFHLFQPENWTSEENNGIGAFQAVNFFSFVENAAELPRSGGKLKQGGQIVPDGGMYQVPSMPTISTFFDSSVKKIEYSYVVVSSNQFALCNHDKIMIFYPQISYWRINWSFYFRHLNTFSGRVIWLPKERPMTCGTSLKTKRENEGTSPKKTDNWDFAQTLSR